MRHRIQLGRYLEFLCNSDLSQPPAANGVFQIDAMQLPCTLEVVSAEDFQYSFSTAPYNLPTIYPARISAYG